jgi:serine protease
MYTGFVAVSGDAGFHYVLLLDAETFLPRYQDEVFTTNGSYAYKFSSVEEGDYIVYAGTDSDNDFFVGDAGESNGAYISLDQPTTIRVNKNLAGIDFSTSFNIDFPTGLSTDTIKKSRILERLGKK